MDCICRLGAALRTREKRPVVSDPTQKPRPSSQRPPKWTISLRLTIQVRLDAITSVATSLGALQASDTAVARAQAHPTIAKVVSDAEAVSGWCDPPPPDAHSGVPPPLQVSDAEAVGACAVPRRVQGWPSW